MSIHERTSCMHQGDAAVMAGDLLRIVSAASPRWGRVQHLVRLAWRRCIEIACLQDEFLYRPRRSAVEPSPPGSGWWRLLCGATRTTSSSLGLGQIMQTCAPRGSQVNLPKHCVDRGYPCTPPRTLGKTYWE